MTTKINPDELDLSPESWLDAKAAATALGISVQSLWNKISSRSDDLPAHYRFGNRLRFYKPDLIRYMRERRHDPLAARARAHSTNPAA